MPVDVRLERFEGFAIRPEDIQFGETDSIEILVSNSGIVVKSSVKRETVTITLRGINQNDAQRFVSEAKANTLNILSGANPVYVITLGGNTVFNASLIKATSSGGIIINGVRIIESLTLEYHSQIYT